MAFSSLSSDTQNLLLVTHSYNTKWFVFLVFVAMSVFYIFFIWKNHKPTVHFTTVMFRLYFYGLSIIYLLVSPMSIILMSPEYNFYYFYALPFSIYTVGFGLFLITLFFDIGKMGILGMLKLAGFDIGDEGVNNFVSNFVNNKHFFKFKKSNKRLFK